MKKKLITNAKIVLENEVIENGSILLDGEIIAAICPENPTYTQEIDLDGKILMPGMIDVHSDAIEKVIEPRANVFYPTDFSIAQIDRLNAIAGITTAYHSLTFATAEIGLRGLENSCDLCERIANWSHEHSLIDNRVHVRYEITDPATYDAVASLIKNGTASMVSLMDHTPGQGQYKSVQEFREYYIRNHGVDESEVDSLIAEKQSEQNNGLKRAFELANLANEFGLTIALHDVDMPERTELMREWNITIAEFPINMETAKRATAEGFITVMGAPNVVRGGSQSGNMSAMDAIRENACAALCSDYTPAAMLPALFRVVKDGVLPLHEAVKLVSTNPARGIGMPDRGIIRVGNIADLIAVDMINENPLVTNVWRHGRNVLSNTYLSN